MATRGWPAATGTRTEQASTRAICRLLALKFRPRREDLLATGACTKRGGGGGAGNTGPQAGAGNTSPQAELKKEPKKAKCMLGGRWWLFH